MKYDLVILTEERYWQPQQVNAYIKNVLLEDRMLWDACTQVGLNCLRIPWSHDSFEWEQTKAAIFRSTWDYFDRFKEFSTWLNQVKSKTQLINTAELIEWNIDKHYLLDLNKKGISIPPTHFIQRGSKASLLEHVDRCGWETIILKPVVSGAGRHTYQLTKAKVDDYESLFQKLIGQEDMMLQKYFPSVPEKGEVSFMMIEGRFTHAMLKKAKEGDFRVQDDFGGTVHHYHPTPTEIDWAEHVFRMVKPLPMYGRVDAIWNEDGNLCVSELELIEPEMWFRHHPQAAQELADKLHKLIKSL